MKLLLLGGLMAAALGAQEYAQGPLRVSVTSMAMSGGTYQTFACVRTVDGTTGAFRLRAEVAAGAVTVRFDDVFAAHILAGRNPAGYPTCKVIAETAEPVDAINMLAVTPLRVDATYVLAGSAEGGRR